MLGRSPENMKSLILLPLLFLVSCEKPSAGVTATDNSEARDLISADELMRALGGNDFLVQLPDDIDSSDMIGLALKHPDGTVHLVDAFRPWEPGSKVRVIIFSNSEERSRYSIVSKNKILKGSFPETKYGFSFGHKPIYKLGETLITYRASSNGSNKDSLQLILHIISKKMENKSQ